MADASFAAPPPAALQFGPAPALWLNAAAAGERLPVNPAAALGEEARYGGVPAEGPLGVAFFAGDSKAVFDARVAARASLEGIFRYTAWRLPAHADASTHEDVKAAILQAWAAPRDGAGAAVSALPAVAVHGTSNPRDAEAGAVGLAAYLTKQVTPFVVFLRPDQVSCRHVAFKVVAERLLELDAARRAAWMSAADDDDDYFEDDGESASASNSGSSSSISSRPSVKTEMQVRGEHFSVEVLRRRLLGALHKAFPALVQSDAGLTARRAQAFWRWWAHNPEALGNAPGVIIVLEDSQDWRPEVLDTLKEEVERLALGCHTGGDDDNDDEDEDDDGYGTEASREPAKFAFVFYNAKPPRLFDGLFQSRAARGFSVTSVHAPATHGVALRVLDWLLLCGQSPLQLSPAVANMLRDDLSELDAQVPKVLAMMHTAASELFGRRKGSSSSNSSVGSGWERTKLSYLCAPLEVWAMRYARELQEEGGGAALRYTRATTSPLFSVCLRVAAWMPEAHVALALGLDSVRAALDDAVAASNSKQGGGGASSSSRSSSSSGVSEGKALELAVEKCRAWLGLPSVASAAAAAAAAASKADDGAAAAASSAAPLPKASPQQTSPALPPQPSLTGKRLTGGSGGSGGAASGDPPAKRPRTETERLKMWAQFSYYEHDDEVTIAQRNRVAIYADEQDTGVPQGTLPLARCSTAWPVDSPAWAKWAQGRAAARWENPAQPLLSALPEARQFIAHSLFRLVARRIGGLTAGAAVFALMQSPFQTQAGDVLPGLRGLMYTDRPGEAAAAQSAVAFIKNAATPGHIAAALQRARRVLLSGVGIGGVLGGMSEGAEPDVTRSGAEGAAAAGAATSSSGGTSPTGSPASASSSSGRSSSSSSSSSSEAPPSHAWWSGAILPARLFARPIAELDALLAQCTTTAAAAADGAPDTDGADFARSLAGVKGRAAMFQLIKAKDQEGPLNKLRAAAVGWLERFLDDWLCSLRALPLHECVLVSAVARMRAALHPRPQDDMLQAVLNPVAVACPCCPGSGPSGGSGAGSGAGSAAGGAARRLSAGSSRRGPAAKAGAASSSSSSSSSSGLELAPSLPDVTLAARTLQHMPGQYVSIRDWHAAFRSVFAPLLATASARRPVTVHGPHSRRATSKSKPVPPKPERLSEEQLNGLIDVRFVSAYHHLYAMGFIRPHKRNAGQIERLMLLKDDAAVAAVAASSSSSAAV